MADPVAAPAEARDDGPAAFRFPVLGVGTVMKTVGVH